MSKVPISSGDPASIAEALDALKIGSEECGDWVYLYRRILKLTFQLSWLE